MKTNIISLIKPQLLGKKIRIIFKNEPLVLTVKTITVFPGSYIDSIKLTFEENKSISHIIQVSSEIDIVDEKTNI